MVISDLYRSLIPNKTIFTQCCLTQRNSKLVQFQVNFTGLTGWVNATVCKRQFSQVSGMANCPNPYLCNILGCPAVKQQRQLGGVERRAWRGYDTRVWLEFPWNHLDNTKTVLIHSASWRPLSTLNQGTCVLRLFPSAVTVAAVCVSDIPYRAWVQSHESLICVIGYLRSFQLTGFNYDNGINQELYALF